MHKVVIAILILIIIALVIFLSAEKVHSVKNVHLLKITSPAFTHNGMIPSEYTCDGKNVNPPIAIDGIPEDTKTLAVIVDDPDAPRGTWVHWLVYNIPPQRIIVENTVPGEQLINDFKKRSYKGPCPPSGAHRYFFKVYALDIKLSIASNAGKKELERAMGTHILAYGELIGLYKRT